VWGALRGRDLKAAERHVDQLIELVSVERRWDQRHACCAADGDEQALAEIIAPIQQARDERDREP
jgi:hypothetical protein